MKKDIKVLKIIIIISITIIFIGLNSSLLPNLLKDNKKFEISPKSSQNIDYFSFFGSSESDSVTDIFIDFYGNIYLCGNTKSADFFTTENAYDRTHNGNHDVFVMKLTPDGSSIIFSTLIGGSDLDAVYDIEVDIQGNIYIAGKTDSTNYPTTNNAFDITKNSGRDIFISKLNQNGSDLIFSTYIGGYEGDYYYGMDLDQEGNIYITGNTWSPNFPITSGAYDISLNGDADLFILKLNTTGENLLYSTFIGTSGIESGKNILVDDQGIIYIMGETDSPNFITTSGVFQPTYGGGATDFFVLKFNISDNSPVFSTFLGGSDKEDEPVGLTLDNNNNLIVGGTTYSSDFSTSVGAQDRSYNGNGDIIVCKINSDGSELLNSTFLGGSGLDKINDIKFDLSNNLNLVGNTESNDFPLNSSACDSTFSGSHEGFFLRFSSDLSEVNNSSYLGGSDYDTCTEVEHFNNSIYIVGCTSSIDFPKSSSIGYDDTYNGISDGFLIIMKNFTNLSYTLPDKSILNPCQSPDSDGNIILTWDSIDYADIYNIYRYSSYISEINGSVTFLGNTNYLSFEDTGLSNGTYYYVVTSINSSGESYPSNCINVTVAIHIYLPDNPYLNPIQTPDGDGVITLTWDSVADVDIYNVYRYSSYISEINGSVTFLGNTNDLSFEDTGLSNGTYYYVVTSINSSGESYPSNCINVTIAIIKNCPFLNSIQSPDGDGVITLTWNWVKGAQSYNIYRHSSYISEETQSLTFIGTTNNLFLVDIGLTNGTYYYVVTAILENGESEISNCVNVTVSIDSIQDDITNGNTDEFSFSIPGYNLLGILIVGMFISQLIIGFNKKNKYNKFW